MRNFADLFVNRLYGGPDRFSIWAVGVIEQIVNDIVGKQIRCQIALGITINEQNAFSLFGQGGGDVYRQRCLASAALVVENR